MVRSCSQPEMIAFNPIVWIRQSRVLYPLRRSPFRYASRTRRSATVLLRREPTEYGSLSTIDGGSSQLSNRLELDTQVHGLDGEVS
jgi:hypothetical protein